MQLSAGIFLSNNNQINLYRMTELCCEYLSVQCIWLYVINYYVMYAFQGESTLYSYPNVKQFLVQNRPYIWSLSDSNVIRSHNHSVCKRTLNHLAKLAKWLSCVVSTYLYGALDCMFIILGVFSKRVIKIKCGRK